MTHPPQQHRPLQPTGPPTQGSAQQQSHARLNESFEAIRQEFDAVVSDVTLLRNQRDELEAKSSFFIPSPIDQNLITFFFLFLLPFLYLQSQTRLMNFKKSISRSMTSRHNTAKFANNMKMSLLVSALTCMLHDSRAIPLLLPVQVLIPLAPPSAFQVLLVSRQVQALASS